MPGRRGTANLNITVWFKEFGDTVSESLSHFTPLNYSPEPIGSLKLGNVWVQLICWPMNQLKKNPNIA